MYSLHAQLTLVTTYTGYKAQLTLVTNVLTLK